MEADAISDDSGVPGALEISPAEAIPDGLTGRWWVAHTKPRNEKALVTDLTALGVRHYLPLRPRATRSRTTGRISRSFVPVFPGYVFFNGTDEHRYLALRTNRIANTLVVTDQAQLIGQLRHIHQVLTSDAGLEWSGRLRVGEWARVVAGPLLGVEGVVCRRLSRLRLVLNVETLGQSVSIEVSRELLERIDGPSYTSPR